MNTPHPATPGAAAGLAQAPFAQYLCRACGYIYDEADGDPDSGLPPGTRFADIPDDWACPLCGVTKADFEPWAPPSPEALRQQATGCAAPAGTRQRAGVVIVGAGRAGWQLAELLRARDADLPITLVTACSGDVYDKPLLSVALARQIAPDALVKARGTEAARRLNLRLLAHTHAIRICADTHTLRTTRGNLRYEHLVLAHGAQPALPPELPPALVWRVNHLDAYRRLRAALGDHPKEVLIIGAGLVGSELANDLALGGHRVTLLDQLPAPLGRWPEAGPPLLQAWQDLPLHFVGGVQVAGLARTADGRLVATTTDGRRYAADQVIAATGLATPSRLARSAGLAMDGGITVAPDTLDTGHARIHALGDCAAVAGQPSRYIEPITRQARTLAAVICGCDPEPYEARPAVVRVKTGSLPLTLH